MTSDLQVLVQDVVGQRCEGAANPHGSILSLDFGALALRDDDEPEAQRHGWRHLTVLCPWRFQTRTEIICDWNTNGGTAGIIRPLIEQIIGQRVISADASPPGWDRRLELSNGWTLVVFGDNTDNRQDAWFILGTDGVEAGAVPIMRSTST